jgi:hypothetical protein
MQILFRYPSSKFSRVNTKAFSRSSIGWLTNCGKGLGFKDLGISTMALDRGNGGLLVAYPNDRISLPEPNIFTPVNVRSVLDS